MKGHRAPPQTDGQASACLLNAIRGSQLVLHTPPWSQPHKGLVGQYGTVTWGPPLGQLSHTRLSSVLRAPRTKARQPEAEARAELHSDVLVLSSPTGLSSLGPQASHMASRPRVPASWGELAPRADGLPDQTPVHPRERLPVQRPRRLPSSSLCRLPSARSLLTWFSRTPPASRYLWSPSTSGQVPPRKPGCLVPLACLQPEFSRAHLARSLLSP